MVRLEGVTLHAAFESLRRSLTGRHRTVFYGSLAAFALLGLNLWSATGLVFTHQSANHLVPAVVLFLPAVAATSGIPVRSRSGRIAVGVLLWPLAVVSAAAGILLGLAFVLWDAPGFTWAGDRLHRADVQVVDVGHHHVVMYPNAGGGTSETGARVRQECTPLPGVLVVRYLYGESTSDFVGIETIGPNRVRLGDTVVTLSRLGWPLCR